MMLLLIAIGGAAGSLARYVLGGLVQESTRSSFPWGTLLVNASGALLLGMIMGVLERVPASPNWRAALAIGFCGAYTTFSTFSYETMRLLQDRQWSAALGNIAGNLMLSVFAVFAGFSAAVYFRGLGGE